MVRFCACGQPVWIEFDPHRNWQAEFFSVDQGRRGRERLNACPNCKKPLTRDEVR
jgi:hypothetical protein